MHTNAFETQDFLRASSRFPSGVAVLTTLSRDGTAAGLTVSSFTSVSLEPPLVLVCVRRFSQVLRDILASRLFAVNVLTVKQEDLSVRFASNTDRFCALGWHHGKTGVPLIPNALAAFECELTHTSAGGDHEILVGHVLFLASDEGVPLVRYGRAYHRLEIAAADVSEAVGPSSYRG